MEDLHLLTKRKKSLLFYPVMLGFNPFKLSSGFTELLGFQLQVPRSNVILNVKTALLRKEPLKENVAIIKHII